MSIDANDRRSAGAVADAGQDACPDGAPWTRCKQFANGYEPLVYETIVGCLDRGRTAVS
jgi:hypothetical protein